MVQSLEKALALLNAVAAQGDWIGVRELARQTGLKPSTAQQLLKTLQAERYLEFDEGSRRYRIGLAALMLSHGVDSAARLGEFARPYVGDLFERYGETAVALVCERGAYSCVCAKQCEKPLATSLPSAKDLAFPHVMACGQALLAWQSEGAVNAYVKARGVDAAAALPERLAKIRAAGFAELIDFNASSVAAYGVPVFDQAGEVALALGWSVPLARFDASLRKEILPALLESASLMGSALGGVRKN